MRLTIAYSKIKKRNLVLINNATYQRETLSERPIRQPLKITHLAWKRKRSSKKKVKDKEATPEHNGTISLLALTS